MSKIRVYMIHSWINSVADMATFIKIDNADLTNDLVWDPDNPEYIFVSEQIYMWKKQYADYIRLANSKSGNAAIWIMVCGEALYPDLNLFDFGICFADTIQNERIGRIPLLIYFGNSVFNINNTPSEEEAHNMYRSRRFCNFMYSNGQAHPMRDMLYRKLNSYKIVESTGRWLHNTDIEDADRNPNWRIESIAVKSNYRFAISCENAIFPGYTTEKLLSSFQAHSVPIYWGNPNVAFEYNEEAFINVMEYENLDELLETVISIDENEDKWCEMVTKPWISDSQLMNVSEGMKRYQSFIISIFNSGKQILRPVGYWPGTYTEWIMRRNNLR